MLSGIQISKRLVQYALMAGILSSAPAWATDIVGTVRKALDSTTAIPGATLILTAGALRDTVVSDSAGHFTFLNVSAGNRSVATTAPGYVGGTVNTTVVAANAFDTVNVYLTVAVPGIITGKVSRSSDSTAITGAKVYLRRSSATAAIIDSVTSDTGGTYTFNNVAPGTPNYWLTVVATGFITGTRTNLAVPNGGTATANFFLTVPGTITGFVKSAADSTTPIAGAMVVRRRGSANGTPIDTVITSALGAYTFTNVTPGTPNYWLTAIATDFLTTTNANVAVPNGGIATSNIYMVVSVPSSIQGTILSAADSITPVANAWIYLRRTSATSAIIDSTQPISTGEYAFGSVSPGTPNYWITVVAPGYLNGTRNNLTVPNSSTVTVNFFLTVVVPGTITGVVTDSLNGGVPVAGIKVVLQRGSATSASIDSTFTDSAGSYSFKNVAPGTPNYWVTASGLVYNSATINNLAVANGGTSTANFSLVTTIIVDALRSVDIVSKGIRFIVLGDQLALELGVSNVSRTVTVYNLSGKLARSISIPAGVSRALVPMSLAPANGFLFQIK